MCSTPGASRTIPTRILRAVRYAGRLGFEIEGGAARLLAGSLRWLDSVSGDRVRREMERTAAEERLADILELADRLGVMNAIHPALSLPDGLAGRLSDDPPPSPLGPPRRPGVQSRRHRQRRGGV